MEAVTESLLTRVTNGNNLIREKIGKEIAQSYIEKILKECEVYDEVLPECEYYKRKQRFDSPDVLIMKGKQICFIDTKLSTPKLDIRKFDQRSIEKTILQYARYIIQVYNRVNDFCNGLVYPFSIRPRAKLMPSAFSGELTAQSPFSSTKPPPLPHV